MNAPDTTGRKLGLLPHAQCKQVTFEQWWHDGAIIARPLRDGSYAYTRVTHAFGAPQIISGGFGGRLVQTFYSVDKEWARDWFMKYADPAFARDEAARAALAAFAEAAE